MIIRNINFSKSINSIRNIILPLNNTSYKGQSGRICVIGGSQEYTGAPYYCAISCLKFGADLAFVYCSSEALIPIKCYSPELIVDSFYDMNELIDLAENNNIEKIIEISRRVTCNFSRFHTIIIGPGLGRNLILFQIIEQIIIKAKIDLIPMIIDADGLFLISKNLSLIYGCKTCILTPNFIEFTRLVNSAIDAIINNNNNNNNSIICQEEILEKLIQKDLSIQIHALCSYLGGVQIILKGKNDLVCKGDNILYIIEESGSSRRCGGQGDILAGCLGVSFYWSTLSNSSNENELLDDEDIMIDNLTKSIILASVITKKASYRAFEKKYRSMTAPDVIDYIGEIFHEIDCND